jgi:hypothetical protein
MFSTLRSLSSVQNKKHLMAKLKFTHATTLLQGSQICSAFCTHSLSLTERERERVKELLLLGRPKEQALNRKDLSSLGADRVSEGRGKERQVSTEQSCSSFQLLAGEGEGQRES